MPCCRVKTELGEEDEEDNRLYSKIVFKIALKAHFQLPNASTVMNLNRKRSKKIDSNQFIFLS